MAVLSKQAITRAGVGPSYVSATGTGDSFVNDASNKKRFLHVKNGHTAAWVVTVTSYATPGAGLAKQNISVSVPNGGERLIGPIPDVFNDADGNVQITYDGVTALTVAVLEV